MSKPQPTFAGYQRAAAGMIGCLLVGGSLGLDMQQQASSAPEDAIAAPSEAAIPDALSGAEEVDYLALRRQVYRSGADAVQLQPRIVTYTVQPGDSLWEIAYALDTDVAVLEELNQGVKPHRLMPGQTLRVISGTESEAVHRRTAQMVASRSGSTADRRQRASSDEDAAYAEHKAAEEPPQPEAELHSDGGWAWPVVGATVTSEFGPRWGTMHEGIDLAIQEGTIVTASRGGVVEFAGWDGGYGYCVVIDHGGGEKSRYAHASALLVTAGDVVEQGTPILKVGSTGNSTGPHLHFEIIIDGQPQNPRRFLP